MTRADSQRTKTCPACCMEIPDRARKCPYCLRLQGKWTAILHHPLVTVLAAYLPMVVVLYLWSTFFTYGPLAPSESFAQYRDQVHVLDSHLQFGQGNSPIVAVVGRVRNDSDVDWDDVRFHVEFRNAEGKLIDAGQELRFALCIPAHEELGFKVAFERQFPEQWYASHTVRVVFANDASKGF